MMISSLSVCLMKDDKQSVEWQMNSQNVFTKCFQIAIMNLSLCERIEEYLNNVTKPIVNDDLFQIDKRKPLLCKRFDCQDGCITLINAAFSFGIK